MTFFPSSRPSQPAPRLTVDAIIRLCGYFFLSRALVLTVACLARIILLRGNFAGPGSSWMDKFNVWDATWYMAIVKQGYYYDPNGPSSVAFYPLYPMLIRLGSSFGLDPQWVGYGISHLALLGACALLWKLTVLETGSPSLGEQAVALMLFCPGAVWFGMIYTESLFLLTMLGCLYAARRRHWLCAGFCGLAAALTRTPGLLLAGFLFMEAVQQWLESRSLARANPGAPLPEVGRPAEQAPLPPPPIWRIGVAALGPVAGYASFLIYLRVRFGDWHAQQKTMAAGWNPEGLRLPWVALSQQWSRIDFFHVVTGDALLAVVLVLAAASLFTLRRVSYPALIFVLAGLYTSSTTGESMVRYLCTAAPVFIVLAQLTQKSKLLETGVLAFSSALLALLTALIVTGYRII